jgi:hypothetical protein
MKTIIRIILLNFSILISISIQAEQLLWSNQIGSYSDDFSIGTSDAEGNFYVSGEFAGSYCQFPNAALTIKGENGLYLASYDKLGSTLWIKQSP